MARTMVKATCADAIRKYEDFSAAKEKYIATISRPRSPDSADGIPPPRSTPFPIGGTRGPGGGCVRVRGTSITDDTTTWGSPPRLVCSSGVR